MFRLSLDGSVQTGRALNEVGAHAKGFNFNSASICLIGGRERDGKYTKEQWASLAELTKAIAYLAHVPIRPPQRTSDKDIKDGICGHRDLYIDLNNNGLVEPSEWAKTCPGFHVADWFNGGMVAPVDHIFTGEVK